MSQFFTKTWGCSLAAPLSDHHDDLRETIEVARL